MRFECVFSRHAELVLFFLCVCVFIIRIKFWNINYIASLNLKRKQNKKMKFLVLTQAESANYTCIIAIAWQPQLDWNLFSYNFVCFGRHMQSVFPFYRFLLVHSEGKTAKTKLLKWLVFLVGHQELSRWQNST